MPNSFYYVTTQVEIVMNGKEFDFWYEGKFNGYVFDVRLENPIEEYTGNSGPYLLPTDRNFEHMRHEFGLDHARSLPYHWIAAVHCKMIDLTNENSIHHLKEIE